MIGHPIVTPISITCLGIWASTNCAITFLAPLSGKIELVFLNDTSLVSLSSKPFTLQAYLATPLRVILSLPLIILERLFGDSNDDKANHGFSMGLLVTIIA
jgi:hypothetical protein